MANIPTYCARKHGEPWEAPHPKIHHLVAETYGILVYQEQVMQIAQELAGYSLGGADLLRRAMGKKIRAEMEKQRVIFCEGAVKNGVDPQKAGEIFDLMEKFADYGFNKSHAAAYALVSYQTAWLKATHPVEFLAASMTLDLDKTEKLAGHMQECSRLGIEVLPPDVNRSGAEFLVEEHEDKAAIRFALAAVKRVGAGAMQDLVRSRTKPFASVADFASRVDPKLLNKMQIENLAKAGAFDSLEPNRARLVAGAEVVLRRAQTSAEERESGQIGLFGGADTMAAEPLRLPAIPDWPQLEKLAYEAEAVGFHLSAHPLDTYGSVLKRLGVVPSSHIQERARAGAARLKLAGTVVNSKERPTRTGSRMASVMLSDAAGSYEVTLFSEVLSRAREMLTEGNALLVTAEARLDGENLRLTAQEIEGLERAAQGVGQGIRLWLEETAAVDHIRALLGREGRGKGRVVVVARTGQGQEVEVALPGGFNVSPRLMQAMKVLPGVAEVEAV
jgi:DNA polymerase III subunit alpha